MRDIQAIVSFSGGQDSSTAAAWAKREFNNQVALVTMNFEGRKETEIQQAKIVAEKLGMEHHILRIPDVLAFMKEVGKPSNDENFSSLIPIRNAIFMTYLASTAYKVGAKKIILGLSGEDLAQYPDTSEPFRQQMQTALNTGVQGEFKPIEILAPFVNWQKWQEWQLCDELGVLDLIVEHTHSCYREGRNQRHEWGYGCGECISCELRAASYFKYLQIKEDKGK